jgi:hypothetical protein
MKICEAGLQKLRRHSYQNIVVPGYNGSFVGAQHVVPTQIRYITLIIILLKENLNHAKRDTLLEYCLRNYCSTQSCASFTRGLRL